MISNIIQWSDHGIFAFLKYKMSRINRDIKTKWKKVKTALAYASDSLSEAQAEDMLYELERIAGSIPLESYDIQSFSRDVEDRFGIDLNNYPTYRDEAMSALARMGSKFESEGYLRETASDMTMEYFEHYCELGQLDLVDSHDPITAEKLDHEITRIQSLSNHVRISGIVKLKSWKNAFLQRSGTIQIADLETENFKVHIHDTDSTTPSLITYKTLEDMCRFWILDT